MERTVIGSEGCVVSHCTIFPFFRPPVLHRLRPMPHGPPLSPLLFFFFLPYLHSPPYFPLPYMDPPYAQSPRRKRKNPGGMIQTCGGVQNVGERVPRDPCAAWNL